MPSPKPLNHVIKYHMYVDVASHSQGQSESWFNCWTLTSKVNQVLLSFPAWLSAASWEDQESSGHSVSYELYLGMFNGTVSLCVGNRIGNHLKKEVCRG